MVAVAATTALGVGSVGVLAAACCFQCSSTAATATPIDAEDQGPAGPELPPELRETNSRLKSVLAALDPAVAVEPGLSDCHSAPSEDGRDDKQLRMALSRVSALEAELELTQVKEQFHTPQALLTPFG